MMNSEKELIIQTYRDYVQDFQSLDPKAILPYYHVPSVSISNRGIQVMNTPEEIEDTFAGTMEILRQQKYARTDIIEIHVRQMSKGLALVSVDLERYTADGELIGGSGKTYPFTYTFRKTEESWKVVVVMLNDRESILRMD
jgi:ketosteroid isomerase-like protein